ncbi:MAG TPA: extracellular solute-binding protein [Candidatus Saccharimonadales bacterium]|jgi:iron(III) transport system substrate-binding protein|nr:extracellular solute-binding protein [Candidatus Saccharimonadales bacterium]
MRHWIGVIVIALALSTTAWAQGGKASTLTDLAKYKGPDRERILYDGAKKEGKLVWYTSLVPHNLIAKVFQAKYPGVTIDIYRAAGNTLATRLVEERRAKRYLADSIESTPPQMMLLRDTQALQPFTSPYLANYPEVSKEVASGDLVFWATDRESLIGVGYNKNAIRAAILPKKFDDLLNPALKGLMSTANNETGARAIGAMLKAKGEGFVRKLKEQNLRPHATTAAGLADLIISGEAPLSFTMVQTNLTQPAATRGAPVAWVPMEVVAVNAGSTAVLSNAPNPHAALLFVDFLLSPDGQKMYAEQLFYGSAAKVSGFERWYPEKGIATEEYEKRADGWLKLLEEITRK